MIRYSLCLVFGLWHAVDTNKQPPLSDQHMLLTRACTDFFNNQVGIDGGFAMASSPVPDQRFQTPPRTRPLAECRSPLRATEFLVQVQMAITGEDLGVIKVSKGVLLRDIQRQLLGAAGGLGVARQAAVIVDDTYYEESSAKPFQNSFHGQRITVVTIPTTDMVYVDQARGAVSACDLQE